MLDLTGIVVSGIMMLLIVWRAVQLDRTLPWFERINRNRDTTSDPAAESQQPPGRRSR